jgi:hypothetical protein
MKGFTLALGTIGILVLLIFDICFTYGFNMGCEQYLKRAADANTVELAEENLEVALAYIERKELTNGVVSIFLSQPKNDIGYWYRNLKSSMDELNKVTEETTQLERSNVLMKLRETLTDISGGDGGGTTITHPSGIEVYPFNRLFFWLYTVFILILVVGGIMCLVE